MQVSVIIPVYNAESFLEDAVQSALDQPQTGEVLLIDDGSTDNSIVICQELAARHSDRIRMISHADGGNHGPSASRNLGIRHAKFDFIGLLDADDFYLPGRFTEPERIFEETPGVDGVYEVVGLHFENDNAKKEWNDLGFTATRIGMQKDIPSDRVYEALVRNNKGNTHVTGWTFKRSVFERAGYFNENMAFAEDTLQWIKIAAVSTLVPGNLDEPVGMYRIHDASRFVKYKPRAVHFRHNQIMWEELWRWAKENLDGEKRELAKIELIKFYGRTYYFTNTARRIANLISRIFARASLLRMLRHHPRFLFSAAFWEQFWRGQLIVHYWGRRHER